METVTTSEIKAKCPSLLDKKDEEAPAYRSVRETDRVRTSSVAGMHDGLVWVDER
jgi:hypothetical protein